MPEKKKPNVAEELEFQFSCSAESKCLNAQLIKTTLFLTVMFDETIQ